MRKLNMIDSPKRAFVPIPENYFDLDETEQLVICEQMALALIAGLGVPDKFDCTVQSENLDHQAS